MAESRINTTTHSATPNPDRRSLWKSRRALLALWGLECDESSPRSLSNSNGEFWTEEDYLQDRGLGCFQISDLSDRKSYKTWVNYMLLISSFFLRISESGSLHGKHVTMRRSQLYWRNLTDWLTRSLKWSGMRKSRTWREGHRSGIRSRQSLTHHIHVPHLSGAVTSTLDLKLLASLSRRFPSQESQVSADDQDDM